DVERWTFIGSELNVQRPMEITLTPALSRREREKSVASPGGRGRKTTALPKGEGGEKRRLRPLPRREREKIAAYGLTSVHSFFSTSWKWAKLSSSFSTSFLMSLGSALGSFSESRRASAASLMALAPSANWRAES